MSTTLLTSFVDLIQKHTHTDVSVHTAGARYLFSLENPNQLSEHTDTHTQVLICITRITQLSRLFEDLQVALAALSLKASELRDRPRPLQPADLYHIELPAVWINTHRFISPLLPKWGHSYMLWQETGVSGNVCIFLSCVFLINVAVLWRHINVVFRFRKTHTICVLVEASWCFIC